MDSSQPAELPSERASDIVRGSRRKAYGHPAPIAVTAAGLWTTWLGVAVSPLDVQMMMALHKIARQKHAPQEDNLTDICGYINILEVTINWLLAIEEAEDGPGEAPAAAPFVAPTQLP